jgi:DNA polymerase III delta prime subunit
MEKNQHIKDYLDYYCDKKNNTPFAVLLNGKWGCGKTYFINNYVKSKKGSNFLHISLYGLSMKNEIDEKIFESLHPILSNPKFKLAAQALSQVIKFSTRIDFNKDGQEDVILDSNGISGLNFNEFAKNSNNKTIIFDDVERCDIEIGKLLGYVNYFVEFFNQKVILIANENDILESASADKYRKIKEKLIGKEFCINPSQEEAIILFTSEVMDSSLKRYSKNIKELLLKIFIQSGYDNLRLIQQALSSFKYFFQSFSSKAQNNVELFEKMFYEFVVIFVEYKKGHIKSEDFFKEHPPFFKGLNDKEKKDHFLDKYNEGSSHWITCFDLKILGKILQGMNLTETEKKALVDNFENMIGLKKESWQKLWYYQDNSDEDFFDNLKDVQTKWGKRDFLDFRVFLHVFGMFLYFSRSGLLNAKKEDILKEGKEYIEFLIQEKKFPLDLMEQNFGFSWKQDAYGCGYYGIELEEWKSLMEFIDEKSKLLKETSIKEKITKELMPVLRGDKALDNQSLDLFVNYNFLHNNGNKEAYFQYLDIDEIVEILTQNKRYVLYALQKTFKDRYTNLSTQIVGIEQEFPFLEELKTKLESKIKEIEKKFGNKKTPRSFMLQSFINESIQPFMSS